MSASALMVKVRPHTMQPPKNKHKTARELDVLGGYFF